jgi:type I restriction enzyme S subunit
LTQLAPYPQYVPVGNRWLEQLPAGWDVVRARYLCRIGTGSGDTIDAVPEGRYRFIVRSPVALASNDYTFDCEAVLTAGDGAVGEVFHHIEGRFHAHQRVYVLRDFRGVHARYFFYYLSAFFRQMARDGSAKTTVDSVRRWMLADFPVAVPPLKEQRAIAAYLDAELTAVDELIVRQERLLLSLAERRRSLVHDVLTRGFDDAPGKNTGIPWIPRVPKHWTVQPLWSMFRRVKNTGHPDEPMLSVFRDHGVVAKDSRSNINATADNRNIYQLVHPGWLVTNRMKAWQGSVGISTLRGIVSGHYLCFEPKHDASAEYLNVLFRSPAYIAGYASISRGVRPGQAEIDNDQYRLLPVVLPPRTEQDRIVRHVTDRLLQIDALVEKTERFIALSKERRAALITAAVIGQIDVRKAA